MPLHDQNDIHQDRPAWRIAASYAFLCTAGLLLGNVIPHWTESQTAGMVFSLGVDLLFVLGSSLLIYRLREKLAMARKERGKLDRDAELLSAELQAIFNAAPMAIILIQDRIIQHANLAAVQMSGYSTSELAGLSLAELFDSTEVEGKSARIGAALASGETVRDQTVMRRRDGSKCWLNSSIHALEAGFSGKRSVCILEDVGAFREAEQKLRESEQRWQFALEGAEQGVWDWDLVNKRAYYSPRWYAMLGYDKSEISGSEEEWRGLIHPDDLPATMLAQQQHLCGETELMRCQYRMRCKNGDYIWILTRGRVAERDADGRPIRTTGTNTDISKTKAAERALENRERVQRTLMDALPVGLYQMDREGRVIFANRHILESFGADDEEFFVGKSIYDVMPDSQEAARARESDREIMARGEPQTRIEQYLVRPTGKQHYFEIGRIPYRNTKGEVAGLHGYIRDITVQVQAQQQQRLIALVFDATRQGIMIVDTGKPARVVAVNRGFTRISGYTEAEVLGRNSTLLSEGCNDESVYREMDSQLTANGHWEGEVWHRRKNGEVFPEFITVDVLRNDLGEVTNYVAMFTDISERHAADQALRNSERLYRSLGDALPMGLFRLKRGGEIIFANSYMTRLMGAKDEREFLGRNMFELTPEVNRAAAYQQHIQVIEHGISSTKIEKHFGLDRSEPRYLEITRVPVFEEDGAINGEQGTFRDVTDQVLAEQQLRLTSLVFESSIQGVMVMDRNRTILTVNSAFTRISGYGAEEVLGRTPDFASLTDLNPTAYDEIMQALSASGHWDGEIWTRRKNGEIFPQHLIVDVLRDENGEITTYIAMFMDISERKANEKRIQYLAQYDNLTDLPNRALLRDRLGLALEGARRHDKKLALLFLDLDRFKGINDSFGHAFGDKLLREVAQRLSSTIRAADTVSRHGGDEFIVMLPDIESEADVKRIARKLIEAIEQPFLIEGRDVVLTLSIGISMYPDDGVEIDTLLRNADTALYATKDAGRRHFLFYSSEMNVLMADRLEIEQELRWAIKRDELYLEYQPQMDLDTRQMVGAEALVRWKNPARGLVSPGEFIPIAEESGQIIEIGKWVMETACHQYAKWLHKGLPVGQLAVNVSSHQFRDSAFVKTVKACLERTGLPPQHLELEVTESVIMQGSDMVLSKLRELEALGVRLAIDDFGTGYSSLSYLKLFPLDRLKVDQAFVRGLPHDEGDSAIVRAVVGLGKNLDLNVLAEGIETEEQLTFLQTLGCHVGQGYYFSRPIPADSCEAFIRAQETRPECQTQAAAG